MNIVEKIQKLLALSSSSNANEAALAAQRAQELMVKYAIDEAALKPEERVNEPIETEVITTDYNKLPVWHALLAYILAPTFFCRSFYGKGGAYAKAVIYFVGRKSDRQSLILTYNHLKDDIEKLAEAEWAKAARVFENIHGKTWKTSFYDGVCATIRERLSANLTQLVADNSGAAIVLANKQKEVDDFVKANHQISQSNTHRRVEANGYVAGKKAGHSLNLGARNTKQLTA